MRMVRGFYNEQNNTVQTAMTVLLSLVLKKKKMAVEKLPVFRMCLSFARNFGIT